jgi:proline iminopeptidase
MLIRVNGVRLFVDVANLGLVPDGDGMREKPTLLMLRGGPGFDHTAFKEAFSSLSDVAQVIFYATAAMDVAKVTTPRLGTSRNGPTT